MKTIRELRQLMDFYPTEVSSQLRYFIRQNIDWNVYLPTKGKNLQRDFVWTLEQKRELINSMLIGRHIPHCAIVNIVEPKDNKTLVELFGVEPKEYQRIIDKYIFKIPKCEKFPYKTHLPILCALQNLYKFKMIYTN